MNKKEIIEQLKQLEEIKVSWQSFSDRFFCLKDTVLTKVVRDQFLLTSIIDMIPQTLINGMSAT